MFMSTRNLLLVAAMTVLPLLSVSAQTDELIHIDAGGMRFILEGYGQVNYNVTDNGSETTNGYDLTRVFVIPTVKITPKLSVTSMLDVASKDHSKVIHEYWAQYKFCDEATIKVGQYKTYYTMENLISPTSMGNIFFHDCMNYMAGVVGDPTYGNFVGRDFGVTLMGQFLPAKDGHKQLGYAVGLMNGSGINQKENNTQKDLTVKLDFMPTKKLTLSASTYLGTGHAIANDPYGQFAMGDNYKRQRIAAGFEANTKPLYLRSEYLRGWDEGIPSQGAYAEAWLHVVPQHKIDVLLDYEYLDKNIHIFDATRNYMAGVQWWFHKKCRISSLFQLKNPATGENTKQWVTQLQLRF